MKLELSNGPQPGQPVPCPQEWHLHSGLPSSVCCILPFADEALTKGTQLDGNIFRRPESAFLYHKAHILMGSSANGADPSGCLPRACPYALGIQMRHDGDLPEQDHIHALPSSVCAPRKDRRLCQIMRTGCLGRKTDQITRWRRSRSLYR